MEYTGERFIPGNDLLEISIEHTHRYKTISPLLKNKTVLDAGCGAGYGTAMIAGSAKSVVGIDISKETVDYCIESYSYKKNIKFINSSIEKLPFNNAVFDCIVCFEVIEHVSEEIQNAFLAEASRVLKKDGVLILSTPNKEEYTDHVNYQNPYHIKEFYYDEFIKYIQTHFKYITAYSQSMSSVSIIEKKNETKNKLELLETKELGDIEKYFICVCSNKIKSIENMNLNSALKYGYDPQGLVSKVYWPDDNGQVSETNKELVGITPDQNNQFILTFKLENLNGKKTLRWDPVENYFCICQIDNIETDGILDKSQPVNAISYYKQGFLFLNPDPQFNITGDFSKATYLTIKGYLKILNNVEIWERYDEVIKNLTIKTT